MSNLHITLGDTSVPLSLVFNEQGTGGKTGLSPTVAVRRVSDGFYLDFDDDAFKSSGWTTRQQALAEVDATNSPGEYQFLWDSSASVSAIADYRAEYETTTVGFESVTAEQLIFDDFSSSIAVVDANVDLIVAKLPDEIIAGSGQVLTIETNIIAEIDANEVKIDIIDTNVDLVVAKLPDETIAGSGQLLTVETNIIAEIDANEAKIDIIDTNVDLVVAKLPDETIAGSGQLLTVETNLTAEIDANEAKIDILDTNVDFIVTKLPDDSIASSGQLDNAEIAIIAEIDVNEVKIDANLTAIQAIQNNTRIVFDVPHEEIIPEDASSKTYRWNLLFFDLIGNMEDADSNPTVDIERLNGDIIASGTFTKPSGTTGEYFFDHVVASGSGLEVLRANTTIIESGVLLKAIRGFEIVDQHEDQLDTIENKIDLIDTNVDSVLVDTNEIQSKMPDETVAGSGQVLTIETNIIAEVDANEVKIDQIQSDLTAISGTLPTALEIADQVWDETAASHTVVGSMGELQNNNADILTDTSALETRLTPARAGYLDNLNIGDLVAGSGQVEANETNIISEIDANEVKIDALQSDLTAISGTFQSEHDQTQSDIAALNNPDAATIASGVWEELLVDHTTVGSVGFNQNLIDDINTDVETMLPIIEGVPAMSGALLADHDTTQVAIAALNDPTVGAIASGVWDEILSAHLASGTTGAALADAQSGSGVLASINDIVDGVWDEALLSHQASGTMGEAMLEADDLTVKDQLNIFTAEEA